MECDLNGFQSIWDVNGNVDILYSYDVSFAVQYICMICLSNHLFIANKFLSKYFSLKLVFIYMCIVF